MCDLGVLIPAFTNALNMPFYFSANKGQQQIQLSIAKKNSIHFSLRLFSAFFLSASFFASGLSKVVLAKRCVDYRISNGVGEKE